ncbi:TIGR04255 family protein [Euzebya sp.]|uniref:TIGR04255 family protein n=1 Tax=Euzebya sp. TaxID=1971409 RepID=UPI0035146798
MTVRPLDLGPPESIHLEESPLTLVVAQIRHEHLAAALDSRRVIDIHEYVADFLGELKEVEEHSLQVSPQIGRGVAMSAGAPTRSWQIRGKDSWVATLSPEAFSLETRAYQSWTHFRGRLEQLCAGVMKILSPQVLSRVGLRYIDEIAVEEVEAPGDWVGRIDSAYLGPVRHPEVGASVMKSEQIIEFLAPNDVRVRLRHGSLLAEDETPVYLLDHDVFAQPGSRLTMVDLFERLDSMHSIAVALFHQSLDRDFLVSLRGGDAP